MSFLSLDRSKRVGTLGGYKLGLSFIVIALVRKRIAADVVKHASRFITGVTYFLVLVIVFLTYSASAVNVESDVAVSDVTEEAVTI